MVSGIAKCSSRAILPCMNLLRMFEVAENLTWQRRTLSRANPTVRFKIRLWRKSMIGLDEALNELVIANRILANEDVVDAYGHVSIRHPEKPERFFMAQMLTAPEMVERAALMEFGLDGEPAGDRRTP